MIELHGLRRDALVEEHPQQRDRCAHVAHRIVRVGQHHPTPVADRLQPMVVGERLEEPERLERARDRAGPILDRLPGERVLQHPEVEARVVGDEDRIAEPR